MICAMKRFGDIYVAPSPIHGVGVFAARDFAQGETIIVWHPKTISPEEYDELPEEELHYVFWDDGVWKRQSEPACYVNFSCEPNSHVVNNADVALRDIAEGEEITSTDSGGEIPYTCTCGSSHCVGKSTRE